MDIWVIVQAAVCKDRLGVWTSAHLCVATCLAGSSKVPSLTLWQEAMLSTKCQKVKIYNANLHQAKKYMLRWKFFTALSTGQKSIA